MTLKFSKNHRKKSASFSCVKVRNVSSSRDAQVTAGDAAVAWLLSLKSALWAECRCPLSLVFRELKAYFSAPQLLRHTAFSFSSAPRNQCRDWTRAHCPRLGQLLTGGQPVASVCGREYIIDVVSQIWQNKLLNFRAGVFRSRTPALTQQEPQTFSIQIII